MPIKRATRQGVKPLIGFYGESGCGKTMTSLLLARGLVGPSGKIVLIDTESGRGSLYADVIPGGYDVLELREPFSPARYIEAIKEVEDSGAGVIVVDSASHEWEGLGGVLDMASEAEARSGKPGLHCWKQPKLEHAKMMLKLLQSPLPIIVCLRAKYKSRQKKDERGKTQIVKDDTTSPIQAEDFIFEMTCHAEILQNHTIILTKCSHPALRDCFPADKTEPVGIKHGELLAKWCANPSPASRPTPAPAAQVGGGAQPTSPPKPGTDEQRTRMFLSFRGAGLSEDALKEFAVQKAWLAPDDELGAWPLAHVPTTVKAMTAMIDEVQSFLRRGVLL